MLPASPQIEQTNHTIDGSLLKKLLHAGTLWLEHNRDAINQLNVFPVPDGDTGTNMTLTMRSAYAAIAEMEEAHIGKIMSALATGALYGARGNSGVILSQLWQGAAGVLANADRLTMELLVQAVEAAVEQAYRSVGTPVEGTILTVARKMMEAAQSAYQTNPQAHLHWVWRRMVVAGRLAVKNTPNLLPILKEAGVVDSGAQGLLIFFEGMLRRPLANQANLPQTTSPTWQTRLDAEDERGYGYDVQFLMHGVDLDMDAIRQALEAMGGWSTLVVGTPRLLKIHVHVHDPGVPISYAIQSSTSIDDVVVENMQRQYEANLQLEMPPQEPSALPNAPFHRDSTMEITGAAIIAVANGHGMHTLFRQWGAVTVIEGEHTMNPSVGDFLDTIRQVPYSDIILLPNNPNIILTAQQAAAQMASEKRIRVVPSRTLPQGIAAMVEYSNRLPTDDLQSISDTMTTGLSFVTTCEITNATRTTKLNGLKVREGQHIGIVNDALVAADDDVLVLVKKLLTLTGAENKERVTFYWGAAMSVNTIQRLVAQIRPHFPMLTYEIIDGGQQVYPIIIGIE